MKSARRPTVVVLALLALGLVPVAHAKVDYSKNAATGGYTPAVAPAAPAAVDYSKNSATGGYAPAVASSVEPSSTASDPAFAWGDAAVGAGAALALVLMAAALRAGFAARSARELAASPAGGTSAGSGLRQRGRRGA
jgi:hypothetical protein